MTAREVQVRGDGMARGHARKIAPVYRDEVLGPPAKRVEGLPEGADDDDAGANKANLERLLGVFDPSVLEEMASDRVVDGLAGAGVQATLIGRAAHPAMANSE